MHNSRFSTPTLDYSANTWKGRLGTILAGWIMRQHNLYFNTENALSKENVADGSIDILLGGVAAVDHQPTSK